MVQRVEIIAPNVLKKIEISRKVSGNCELYQELLQKVWLRATIQDIFVVFPKGFLRIIRPECFWVSVLNDFFEDDEKIFFFF